MNELEKLKRAKELKRALKLNDEEHVSDIVKDMNPFQYRDTYGKVLDDVVHNDYRIVPKYQPNTKDAQYANLLLSNIRNGYVDSIEDLDSVDRAYIDMVDEKRKFGYDWAGLKGLFEDTRIPLTNNLRYVNPNTNNILERNGASGLYRPRDASIYVYRPTQDTSTWDTSTVLHELKHNKQFNEGFDSVPYAYHNRSLANPTMDFGGYKVEPHISLMETKGGREFMSDLYLYDRDTFNEIIKNRGSLYHDLARGDIRAEASMGDVAMGVRSHFSKGEDMARSFWNRHHKYGIAEEDAARRLLRNEKLRSIIGAIAPYGKALQPMAKALPYVGTAAGLAAISGDVMAGDYNEAAQKTVDMGIGEIPVVGDLIQSDPLNEGEDEIIMNLRKKAMLEQMSKDKLNTKPF